MRSIDLSSASRLITLWSFIAATSVCQFVTDSKDQTVIASHHHEAAHIIRRLIDNEIIPQVVDNFQPSFGVAVNWGNDVEVDLGNTLKPDEVANFHELSIRLRPISDIDPGEFPSNVIMVLTDPDARSYDDPDWSEVCHFIAGEYLEPIRITSLEKSEPFQGGPISIDLEVSKAVSERSSSDSSATMRLSSPRQPPFREIPYEVVSYKAPAPPPKTGKHRYVWLLMVPANDTTARIHPSQPSDRKHWGYDGIRVGARQWANENGLVVVGANFFYAQNEQQ